MQSGTAEKPLGVRVPSPLHQCLKSRAIDHRRTFKAEVIVCLEDAIKRQDDAIKDNQQRSPAIGALLDDALTAAINVSSSVGLLGDLFGEVGVARRDSDIAQLSRALDIIRREAEKVGEILGEVSKRSSASSPAVAPSSLAGQRLARRASDQR